MKTYTKKVNDGEMVIYEEVLNGIADKYNPSFSILVLPKAIEVNKKSSLLVLPYYEGDTFNEKWTEATGGSLLGLDLSAEIPEVLYELSQIDVLALLGGNVRLQEIPKLIFNSQEYLLEFEVATKRFFDAGLLERSEIDQAKDSIKKGFASPLLFNNGDFYPRNFIRLPDRRLVLIDWETWNPNSRAYLIDHPENIAALCFVHMWNNEPWQKNYVKELLQRFSMRPEDFQRAVLIKSLDLADFWFKEDGKNSRCQSQLSIFKNTLNPEYISKLFK